MHSQACFLSYQLQDIHISLLWCSQPNRNTEMEPLLSFYIVLSFSFSPQFLLNFHFLNRGYWFTPFSLSKVIYLFIIIPSLTYVLLYSCLPPPFFPPPLSSPCPSLPSALLQHPAARDPSVSIVASLAGTVKGSPSGTPFIYWNETRTESHPSLLTLYWAYSSFNCTAIRNHITVPPSLCE